MAGLNLKSGYGMQLGCGRWAKSMYYVGNTRFWCACRRERGELWVRNPSQTNAQGPEGRIQCLYYDLGKLLDYHLACRTTSKWFCSGPSKFTFILICVFVNNYLHYLTFTGSFLQACHMVLLTC